MRPLHKTHMAQIPLERGCVSVTQINSTGGDTFARIALRWAIEAGHVSYETAPALDDIEIFEVLDLDTDGNPSRVLWVDPDSGELVEIDIDR